MSVTSDVATMRKILNLLDTTEDAEVRADLIDLAIELADRSGECEAEWRNYR